MDLNTGHVYVGAELDRETRDLYILNLTVKDRALNEGDRRATTMEVPTFVTAHTFCASRDTRVSYGWCLLIQGYFARFKTIRRKHKCFWYPKRKLGVAPRGGGTPGNPW